MIFLQDFHVVEQKQYETADEEEENYSNPGEVEDFMLPQELRKQYNTIIMPKYPSLSDKCFIYI